MSSKKINNKNLSVTAGNVNNLPIDFLKLAKFTDFTLICGDATIRAHRILLAVRSNYFQEYFKRNQTAKEIVLDIDFDDLILIILYMYQGVIVIPVDRKASFLELAQQFNVNINVKNIFAVRTRMEKFAGNEYNEMNFQQLIPANNGDICSANKPEIVHVNFKREVHLPNALGAHLRMPDSTDSMNTENQQNKDGDNLHVTKHEDVKNDNHPNSKQKKKKDGKHPNLKQQKEKPDNNHPKQQKEKSDNNHHKSKQQMDKSDVHSCPNVVHIKQNDFLKLLGCNKP